MRRRLSLCTTALILLLAWLAVTTVGTSGENRFLLEVPATYLSVGQQFQPRLVSLAASAAVPSDDVTIELRDGGGRAIHTASATLDGTAAIAPAAWSLPGAGSYQLRASGPQGVQTISLRALPDVNANFGGVMGLTAFGLSDGAADYLRQHGFAVTRLAEGDEGGPGVHIVVGDPRLPGVAADDLNAQYRAFWRMVGEGAAALVLQPPPPGVAADWPAIAPLVAAPDGCTADAFASPFNSGLPADAGLSDLLRPALVFDLQQPHLDAYHWDGGLMLKPKGRAGYEGCHALFSFRYGQGWVTMSTLPLLQHFQDARARIVLLNLVQANARRKQRRVPPSPGLQWITEQRLKQMAAQPPNPAAQQAIFYRPQPAAVEPAPQLVPLEGGSCWSAPAGGAAGASVGLEATAPFAAHTVEVAFGSDRSRWPTAFHLLASSDGSAWRALPSPPPDAEGKIRVDLPAAQAWRAFRLSIEQAPARWSLCGFSAR